MLCMWKALEELNMSALKSSPTLRWERRVSDENEMPASEQRVYRQLVGKLFCIDRTAGEASSSLGRASDTDKRHIKSILRYLRGNHGIMTVQPTTLNLEAVQRAPVGSVLTYRASDERGYADQFSVSGTALRLRSKLRRYPITAEQKTIATVKLS